MKRAALTTGCGVLLGIAVAFSAWGSDSPMGHVVSALSRGPLSGKSGWVETTQEDFRDGTYERNTDPRRFLPVDVHTLSTADK